MIKTEGTRYWGCVGAAFVVAFGLQLVGAAFVLPLLVFCLLFLHMPVPRPMQSVFGRALTALVFSLIILQVSALVQFLVWPSSNFVFISAFMAAMAFAVVRAVGRPTERVRWFTRYDIVGIVAAVLFVVPLLWMVRQDTVANIVSIAGLQSPDAGHHFEFIGDMMHEQHFDSSGYPKSFHLAVGYLQNAFVGSQDALSWQANVLTFFAQYVLFGVMLAMALGYLCVSWLERLRGSAMRKKEAIAVSFALALPLQIVVLWPFVEHGFLNYLYLVIVIALTALYLDELLNQKKVSEFEAIVVLLLALAAALTWPLVVPAMVLGLIMTLWPQKPRDVLSLVRRHKIATILVLLQFVPLVVQLLQPGTTSINDQGDLRTLAVFLLLAGVGVAVGAGRMLPAPSRRVLVAVLVPFAVLMGAILLMQLVLFGEPRYFAIKVALLLEALLLPLGVAWLFAWAARRNVGKTLLLLVLAPLGVTTLLVAASGKPFEDVRNLFRDQLGQVKPTFYEHDVSEYTKLGKAGSINYYNSTVLHYNTENHKLYSHPFLPQVVQMMKYYRTPGGLEAFACHKQIFNNLAYGDFSEVMQKELVDQVRTCAHIANRNGQKYYIITDNVSLERVRSEIGEGRGIVYVGQ